MSPRRAKAIGGRVGDDPAAALREHLIDITEGLLTRTPVAAITTRDIARAAGVSDGVLYNYFEDKSALILAALVQRYRRLARRFFDALAEPGQGEVEDNLTAYATGLLDVVAESLPTVAGLLTEPLLFHSLFEEIHRDELSPVVMQAKLHDYLVGEQALGRLKAADLTPVPTLLAGAVMSIVLSSHLAGMQDPGAARDQLRPIVATILRGLA
jgi:AcrR family transcriptional regulator